MSTDYPIDSSPMFNAIHDCHNNALKFKIIKFTEPNLPRAFKGRKWNIPGGFITPNWLVLYYNRREKVPLRDLPKTAEHIVQGMVNTAVEISQRYNLEIDPTPLPFSSNRPEVKTPYTSAVNFIEKEAKAVYPVPSPIELTGPNAVANSMNLTEMIVRLDNSVQMFHKEIEAHIEATKRWEAAADRIAQSKPKEHILSRIYKLISRLMSISIR